MKMNLPEPLRPFFHFTAPKNWINDPNGMVYYDGEYHLFYQHYPHDNSWGPMHWGHAVSIDLVNWQHLPIALYPDELGYIFSGGAVIDWENTAAFGKEAMVAFFTHHDPATEAQSQSLAYSLDKGRSWTKYVGNPVIPPHPERRDFRDPKVIWYEDGVGTAHWVMLIAAGDVVMLYTSVNLRDWTFASTFGGDQGALSGVWETPDLFQLPISGTSESRWVLTVGVGAGASFDEIKMQYFVGQFDGQQFRNENDKELVLWADHGADFYAAQAWSDAPNGRRVWLAWMTHWAYARVTPPKTWRGAMTLPREIGLKNTAVGPRLVQSPVPELQQLRQSPMQWQNMTITHDAPYVPEVEGELFEIITEFDGNEAQEEFGIRVQVGDGEFTAVSYTPKTQTLCFDRSQSGQTDFHEAFAEVHRVRYAPSSDTIRLHLFVDRSAIELFVDDGQLTMAERVFPHEGNNGIQLYTVAETALLKKLTIYPLKQASFLLPQLVKNGNEDAL